MKHEPDTLTPEILGELEQYVQSRLNSRIRDFRLYLRGEGLVMEGYTDTYYAKQLAQHEVMDAIDVPIHANDIEVI